MRFLHNNGIYHRDMKPENVMLDGNGMIKVIDLGIARRLDDHLEADDRAFRTATGKIMGSPAYIAPESIAGDAIDGRTDTWQICTCPPV